MALATEPIGSMPRPRELLEEIGARVQDRISQGELDALFEEAVPFGDDVSTARETAFAKIRARVTGTELASRELGV